MVRKRTRINMDIDPKNNFEMNEREVAPDEEIVEEGQDSNEEDYEQLQTFNESTNLEEMAAEFGETVSSMREELTNGLSQGRVRKIRETKFKKDVIYEVGGYTILKKAGPVSKQLLDNITVKKFGKNGTLHLLYRGIRITKLGKGGTRVWVENQKSKEIMSEFVRELETAKSEYLNNTVEGQTIQRSGLESAAKTLGLEVNSEGGAEVVELGQLSWDSYDPMPPNDVAVTLFQDTFTRLEETIDEITEELQREYVIMPDVVDDRPSQSKRVVGGLLMHDKSLLEQEERAKEEGVIVPNRHVSKELDAMSRTIEDMLRESKNNSEKRVLKKALALSELKADRYRMIEGERLETESGIGIMDEVTQEHDLTRLEKFKRWARQNLLALSGVAIMAGTLITAIVAAVRAAGRATSKAASAVGKALAELAKKLGPILGPIISFIGTVLSMASKGAAWLANNLWLLALAIVYFLYQETKGAIVRRRNKRK